ncbi:type IV secretion system VirB4 protein [Bacillus sp. FJAT-27231]|uniref:VirB4 family type IV secretion system protein n=1 Tax=Bacillus sp. FJAT-27231 TaxID=1679168 RepID=UPI0006715B6C|nr:type IV secretion system VirB4 protein [Bacillus sp. FJAT-27231]KMY52499.1 type IV secretion system VirB4 protein [Bacillus sp. FJAT-27231]
MFKLNFKKRVKTEKELKDKKGYNPYFLARIQPQGGVKFEESYIRKGDGYEACIHVYDYQSNVTDFWLEEIMNMPNVITTLDVISDNRKAVIESINKSMAEHSVRHATAKENIDRLEASQQYRELEELYQRITNGEVMKRIHLRIYISGKIIDDLEKQAKEVIENLEAQNFRGSIFLNEQEYEFQSLVTGFETQKNYINKRRGKEITSLSLAGGFPFHFTQLSDPYGTFYGSTQTKGSVIFDQFHKDHQRKSYNAVLIGQMGAGKSTLLKKSLLDNAIKGYKIRVFDIVGEFKDLVDALGGKTIALDGSQGIINPLQVYKTVTKEDGSPDEALSFTQHLSKLTVFYRFITPEATDDQLKEYENLLRKLYISKGLWDDQDVLNNNITGLPANEYPILSDFLTFIREELYEDFGTKKHHDNLGESRKQRLELIELNIENLVETYAHLFDGFSTIEDFNDEQIVAFSLRHLSSLKPEIFQAQLFNVMNLLWDGMLQNGAPQLKAFNQGVLKFEDAVRYLILIDEAHHIINTKKGSEHALRFLTKFSREARKYFGGLFFASHSIRDFVPEGSDQTAVEEIKILFELTQYKFIMQQDNNSLDMLRRIFSGQLNESEVAEIPYLSTGNVLLCISSVKNVRFQVEVTDEELALYGGGA